MLLERCVEVTQRILVLAQLLGAESAEVVLLPLVALLRRERLAKGLLGRLPLPLAVVLVAAPHSLHRHRHQLLTDRLLTLPCNTTPRCR